VTSRVLGLVLANLLMLGVGVGLLPLLRLAATRRELLPKLPLAYAVGVAATGIVAADVAVVGIAVGWIALPLLTAVSLTLGLRAIPASGPRRGRRDLRAELAPLAVLAIAAVFLAVFARALAVIPLQVSDGWTIWGTRARALYELGSPNSAVFTSSLYPALQHPLWLPAIEALDFRFMRGFDGTLVGLQLLGLVVAFVGGAWVLLRGHAPRLLLAAVLLAIVGAPTFYNQLQTNFADVPLAMFVALGVAALAAWLGSGDPGLLPAAVIFLGAAALTKNEGELFALAAFVAAVVVARRDQRRPLALAALATFALDLPWRIWIQVQHVTIAEYSISDLFDPAYLRAHSDRVGPSAHELVSQIARMESWSYLVVFCLFGLAGGLVLRRFRLTAFGASWLLLSFAGLVAIYWISTNPLKGHLFNSADRTIVSLVIACALLVPVLLAPEREPEPGEL
jgi:hypothetical protein